MPGSPTLPDPKTLPDLDFGEPLGAAQGVVFYSNLDDYYFSGEKSFCQSVYTGFKYQCVEGARRHMLNLYGCIFGQCGPAGELFGYTEVDNVVTGEKLPWVACKNGETKVKPAVGMTLIYPICKKMPVGHVAVIGAVGDDWVGIAEENQESKTWGGRPYGRCVPLKQDENGNWLMEETDPALVNSSGWLYIEGAEMRKPLDGVTEEEMSSINDKTLHEKVYPPLQVKDEFITQNAKKTKRMAQFTAPVLTVKPDLLGFPDERNSQVDSEKNETVKKQLEEIKGRREAQKRSRLALIDEYQQLVDDRFKEEDKATKGHHFIKPHEINNGQGHLGKIVHPKRGEITVPYARSAAPRTTMWSSIFSGSEELSIGSIGQIMRAYKIVEQAVVMFCDKKTYGDLRAKPSDDASVAKRYDIPQAALEAIVAQVNHMIAAPSASKALSKLDYLLGTMSLVFDREADHYKILHTELDSLANLLEINGIQEFYAKVTSNLKWGWLMTTFGNDLHRAIRNFQKLRYGIEDASKPFVFLDFGSVSDLAEKHGFKNLPKDVLFHYQVERLQSTYMVEYLKEFLEDKAHDLAVGDLAEDDPYNIKWNIVKVNFWDDKQVKIDKESGKLFFFNGKEMEEGLMLWKMCPWSSIFAMHYTEHSNAEADEKLELFLDKVAYDQKHPRVFQPLWTHIASHPQFMPFLSRAAARMQQLEAGKDEAIDNLKERLEGDIICKYTIPVECWPTEQNEENAVGLPKCTYRVNAFEGAVNPDPTGDQDKKYNPPISDIPHKLRQPKQVYPAAHSLLIGGKRSASCWIESRVVDEEEEKEGASIWDLVLPSGMAYMPSLFPRGT